MGITSKRVKLLHGEPPVNLSPLRLARIRRNVIVGSRRGRNRLSIAPTQPKGPMTWAEFCDLFQQSQRPRVSTMFHGAEHIFRKICAPTLLADVTGATIELFIAQRRAANVGIESVQRNVSLLRLGLKWGFDERLIEPWQFSAVRRPGGGWKWVNRSWKAAA